MIQWIKKVFYLFKYRTRKIKIGKRCVVGGINSIFEGYNAIGDDTLFSGEIGSCSYIGKRCSFDNVKIGRYCSIANDVKLIIGNHPTKKFVSTHPAFFSTHKQAGVTFVKKDLFEERKYASKDYYLIVGNDVWIGAGVIILNGITIGDGAIIAAGAVVTKDVAPYSIVGGIPAKTLRMRFDDKQIDYLLNFKWWNRQFSWINSHAHFFTNITKFISEVQKEDENSNSTGRI